MNILVIDAQDGGIGKQLVEAIKEKIPKVVITAVGTNVTATSAMLKAGADNAATGENAVIVGCRRADVIIGPIGIAIADAMHGEITPTMALSVGQSMAKRILLPMNNCGNIVVGVSDCSINHMVDLALEELNRTFS